MTDYLIWQIDQKKDVWTITKDGIDRVPVLEGVTKAKVWEWLKKNTRPDDDIHWMGYRVLEKAKGRA